MKKFRKVFIYAIIAMIISFCNVTIKKECSDSVTFEAEFVRAIGFITRHKELILGFIIAFLAGIGKGFLNLCGTVLGQKLQGLFILYLQKKVEDKGKSLGEWLARKILAYYGVEIMRDKEDVKIPYTKKTPKTIKPKKPEKKASLPALKKAKKSVKTKKQTKKPDN